MFNFFERIQTFSKILILATLLGSLGPTIAYSGLPPFRIVIDPGHGGRDEGTIYHEGSLRLSEKQITLRLAHQVQRILKKKGYSVILTRTDDRELSLPSRTALANRLKANLFISIHMNQSHGGLAQGVETYIMNHTSDASSRRLARLENSVLGNHLTQEGGSDVALILKDLRLDSNLSESKRLACLVQDQLVSATSQPINFKKRNRGVKQGLFYVLLGADMPSILVEAGFLSHAWDRALVLSSSGQELIGDAISKAVDTFAQTQKQKSLALSRIHSCQVKESSSRY
ncbi:N-acetylmuramoyl-L-alanine amidase [bacterium]|nr:N-acetylmuramoyl-L-alanine amidase [bacterium]